MAKFTKQTAKEMGSKGGKATVERHGRSHMQEIARRGFQAVTEKYFSGSEGLHKSYLVEMGLYQYWLQSGLPMKFDKSGRPVWPDKKPIHPARGGVPF